MDSLTTKHYLSCGILLKYHETTLEDFTNDEEVLKQIKSYLSKVEEFKKDGVGIYLWGANGVGKTLCMTSVFKELIKKRYRVRIVSFSDLITSFANGWYDKVEQNAMTDLKRVDFLGIEEIGKEFKSREGELARTVLDNILRYRVQMNKPTWVTSNMKPSVLKATYSEDIASMLKECCLPIQVTGIDFREKIMAENKKKL